MHDFPKMRCKGSVFFSVGKTFFVLLQMNFILEIFGELLKLSRYDEENDNAQRFAHTNSGMPDVGIRLSHWNE